MTHKYERQCWSCGSKDVEKDSRGVRCRQCGATWNEVPSSSLPVIEVTNPISGRKSGRRYDTSGSPSPGVKRRAARARGELPPKRQPKKAA